MYSKNSSFKSRNKKIKTTGLVGSVGWPFLSEGGRKFFAPQSVAASKHCGHALPTRPLFKRPIVAFVSKVNSGTSQAIFIYLFRRSIYRQT